MPNSLRDFNEQSETKFALLFGKNFVGRKRHKKGVKNTPKNYPKLRHKKCLKKTRKTRSFEAVEI